MTDHAVLRLRKDEDRRIRAGHLWVYSNEIDVAATPLATLEAGTLVDLQDSRGNFLGRGYANPRSLIAVRLLTRNANWPVDASLFRTRIVAALTLREKLFEGAPYYRLIHGEGDGLPGLVVDRFGEYLVVQPNTAGIDRLLDQIIEVLVETVFPTGILIRADSSARIPEGLESYVRVAYGTVPDSVPLVENGVRFEAPVSTGQKTGWFYDHRLNRERLRRYVPGARVLDVFSYIGGWGVQAAAAGAREVLCVDSSAPALEAVAHNAALNGVESIVNCERGDAFEVLTSLRGRGERFDVVVLDPPPFIKRKKDAREGEQAYQRINRLAMELVIPGGILVTSSCSFHMGRDTLLLAALRASTGLGREAQLLEEGHQGPDHPIHLAIPETSYLKAFFLRVG
ncbi:MAG: class I SAM-dependent rRNA methyltransferase [Gemmatimonadota bacterium]|jgi:23S rRNA (cytosine1962-C5)-methyltransferase|nr:class I SAM-dependent rRNA methyltransferase [Gemmatimonadota bacterium]